MPSALERLGPSGHAIFSDISQDLLDHCHAAAAAEERPDWCRFVLASADSLDRIADASVDVVTTRSVLIYVKDKAAALRAFHRVLRVGGRMTSAISGIGAAGSVLQRSILASRIGQRALASSVLLTS